MITVCNALQGPLDAGHPRFVCGAHWNYTDALGGIVSDMGGGELRTGVSGTVGGGRGVTKALSFRYRIAID